jgi:hypothetical protein
MRALRISFAVLAIASAAIAGGAKTPALFVYEEGGGDTISFFPPSTVRIIHAATADAGVHACQYDLPDNGNMYSGADVENAFKSAVVQSEMRAHHVYVAPAGKLTAGSDEITWMPICRGACASEPAPVAQLHQTLRTVMLNARLVCP